MSDDDPGVSSLRVLHLQRRPFPHEQFSIERVFDDVRNALPSDVAADVFVSSFPSTGLLSRLRAVLEARRVDRTRRPDVCHVTGDVHFLVLGLRRANTVLTVHDCEVMYRAGAIKRALYRYLWLVLPVRRARLVTVTTEMTKQELLGWVDVPSERIRVVANPVTPALEPSPPRTDHDPPRILQIGTRPNKNLERVVDALEGFPCELSIVGPLSDTQRARLDARNVTYRHWLDLDDEQMAERYRDADLLVFASTREGFGIPILEAQACTLPVVTSDRAPMRDVAGAGALLVDPDDTTSIRAGIERVAADPAMRAALVAAGSENVGRFRSAAIAEQYAALYREVAATAP